MRLDRRAALLGLGLAALPSLTVRAAEPALIAAASSLQLAAADLAAAFVARGHAQPRLVFGSSGNITRQIMQGAPFELFLAADEVYLLDLGTRGHLDGDSTVYARGRLAIVAVAGSPVMVDARLDGLGAAIEAGRVTRLAIANPELAPYGRAARQALEALGLWDKVQGRLAIGENVAQATQFALSGAAEAGLVARSLVLAPSLDAKAAVALVDASLHDPIDQRMSLIKGAGLEARAFFGFMQQDEARAILERHGFDAPGEAAAR